MAKISLDFGSLELSEEFGKHQSSTLKAIENSVTRLRSGVTSRILLDDSLRRPQSDSESSKQWWLVFRMNVEGGALLHGTHFAILDGGRIGIDLDSCFDHYCNACVGLGFIPRPKSEMADIVLRDDPASANRKGSTTKVDGFSNLLRDFDITKIPTF